jgi:thymidylate synthase (FAD)
MKVDLIAYTPNPIQVVYTACRTCYSAQTPKQIYDNALAGSLESQLTLIDSVIASGHHSVTEHINFTWAIEGVSRSLSHQFVRHRHASPSQQSQRYVTYKDMNFIVPPHTIDGADNDEALECYDSVVRGAFNAYQVLIDDYNVPAEDARMVLPNATPTNLLMTMNLREFMHICNLRLCQHAQWEIRGLVNLMRTSVTTEIPSFAKYLVPECEMLGYCPQQREPKGCRRPTKAELLAVYEQYK